MPIKKLILRGNEIPTFAATTESEKPATRDASRQRKKKDLPPVLTLQRSFRIESGALRGSMEKHAVEIDDDNMIELVFDDNTTWFSGPSSIEEIFPSAAVQNRSADGGFVLPHVLENVDADRGGVGKIALKIVNIFLKPAVQAGVRVLAKRFERAQLDHQVGLFALNRDFEYVPFAAENTSLPYLCFLHGTASSTKGSFAELTKTDVWKYILGEYGNRILAYQHESLSESPLYNTWKLIQQLPNNATLHLISHSRGGLIGEILCRYAAKDESNRGFDQWEKDFLKKAAKQGDDAGTANNPLAVATAEEEDAETGILEKVLTDYQYIEKIEAALKNKKITVAKFIRVACPAAGTVLASKRMDNFLNMLFNLIGFGSGLAATPAYQAFRNLVTAVVDSKNQKNILPGLEAMNPESDFIKVLNRPGTTIRVDTPLRIIAGNCKAKISLKGLLVIASKLFYLQDNDLVVNTRSMYHGTTSRPSPQFYFDQSTETDHFHYFKNPTTTAAILNALKTTGDELLKDYRYITPAILAGSERGALLGIQSGQLFTNTVTGTKPIVVLLPGIMGSNIAVNRDVAEYAATDADSPRNKDLVWIDYWDFIKGGLRKLDISAAGAVAPSIVSTSYGRLVKFLEPTYDVITFPYDWRLSLTESAGKLNDKLVELLAYNQPIKVIAHSMGGVLFRDFMMEEKYKATWDELKKPADFKAIFLGTPFGGSYRIPAVLFGIDSVIKLLSKIDIIHTRQELVNLFAKFPGLLNLLPLGNTGTPDFADKQTWKGLGSGMDWDSLWPGQELDNFRIYRDKVLNNLAGLDYTNMVYIAGKSKDTYCGIRTEENDRFSEVLFLSTGEGDGSVTWESGIPNKMIENNAVYYTPVAHGNLANEPGLFNAIADVLATGQTNLLSRKKPLVRSSEQLFLSPVKEVFDVSEENVTRTLLGLEAEEDMLAEKPALKVWVTNGDLKYAEYPVLAGHFKYDGILNAEKDIDKNLHFALSERHKIGLYPGDIGTNEIFISNDDLFPGAIIAGLGKFGDLTAFQLTMTVEQGVSNYLLTLSRNATFINNTLKNKSFNGLSALLVGSGYGGLSVDACVRAIIQGVQNANAKIRKLKEEVVGIQELEFIELYEDTALSCFYSLSKIEKEEDSTLHIMLGEKTIKKSMGRRQRLPSDTTADWWKRISVELLKPEITVAAGTDKKTVVEIENPIRHLQFTASTGGAREEQRMLYSSPVIIEQLLEDMSTHNRWTPSLAKTIFELLVPNDFKEQLKKQGNINWILDKNTATYPWELLQDTLENAKPLCVNAGMIRQLATEDARWNIQQVTSSTALIIADPQLKGFLPQLAGAQQEGSLVNEKLSSEGYEVAYLPSATSPQIIEALFSKDYKIVHLAGHGMFDERRPENSGMAIGDRVILSPREIMQMSTTPELVFVNCCYLGRMSGLAEAYTRSRYKLAANIGTQLIDNGVKAVIAAGWAVDDAAALDFTHKFYDCMFEGSSFGDAVREARRKVYEKYKNVNNTWGAYQCYGDPFYKLKPPASTKKKTYAFVIAEQADIELSNLRNKLETGSRLHADVLEEMSAIGKAIEEAGIVSASVTEKEALIYASINEYDMAIARFEKLRSLEDASFTIYTLEKYCNVRAKKIIADYKKEENKEKIRDTYIKNMKSVLRDIATLLHVSPTAERLGIMGSTYKRLAFLTQNEKDKIDAYKNAAYYYYLADKRKTHLNSAYAFTNRIAVESILVAAGIYKWGKTAARVPDEIVVANEQETPQYQLPTKKDAIAFIEELLLLKSKITEKSDFYELVAVANLQFAALLVEPANDKKMWQEVKNSYQKIWTKAGTKAHKVTEIEHLELLAEALTLVKNKAFEDLNDNMKKLREDLEKLV